MDQQSEQPVKAEHLVRKLKPWWGIAIASLLALGGIGGALAIHYAGAVNARKEGGQLSEGRR